MSAQCGASSKLNLIVISSVLARVGIFLRFVGMQQQINNNAFVVVLIVAALFKVRLLNRSCHACFLFVFILGRPLCSEGAL